MSIYIPEWLLWTAGLLICIPLGILVMALTIIGFAIVHSNFRLWK